MSNNEHKNITIPSKNEEGKEDQISILSILGLLCYLEPEKSDLAFLLTEGQR